MITELFIYISVGLLFLSTLILPVGNYYNTSKEKLTINKINEIIEYTRTKSYTELSDYMILASEDYVFISKSNIEDDEVNIVEEFKVDKKQFYKNLDKKYKDYKVVAEFSNGEKIYPEEVIK